MATILYARVSTAEQTIDHQIAHARAAGFTIDEVVADNGVSGLSTRLTERPEGRRLYDKLRAGDTLVVRWVDPLGRNYEDVCDAIREFMRRGVVIRTVINNFTFDGSTKDAMQQAVRDALIAFMAATAQAQAEATKAAQKAGIEHAKQFGDRAYLGRKPSYTRQQYDQAKALLAQDAVGIARIAKETGLTRQTIYRIRDDPASAEAALAAWGLYRLQGNHGMWALEGGRPRHPTTAHLPALTYRKGGRMNDPRIQRRRDLANSLYIPAELATPFTEGEMAALKIIADEHVRCGACTLARDTIAALSCTSRTVVKDAIRTAEAAGLLKREQIRGRGRRYTTITIISAKWLAWLDRREDTPLHNPPSNARARPHDQ